MRRGPVGAALALVVPALVTGGLFLGLYLLDGYEMPIGFDTARYLAETELVAEHGPGEVEALAPLPSRVLAGRVGFPVLTLTQSALLSTSRVAVAAVLPAVAAVALGLAAGALAARILDRRRWTLGVAALVAGTSPAVVRLAAPEAYTENLMAAAVFIAAAALLVAPGRGAGRVAGAAGLLAAGGLFHPYSLLVIGAVLALTALWLVPGSWRRWRGGDPALATPSGRIAAALAGGTALWAVLLFGAIGAGLDSIRVGEEILRDKLSADLPIYRFPLTLPLAALGAAAVAMRLRRTRGADEDPAEVGLVLIGAWTAVTIGAVALLLAGAVAPAHRLLAFFLPLPVLAAAGLMALGDRIARAAGRALGVAIVLAGVAGLVTLSARTYYQTFPAERGVRWLTEERARGAATAARYLDEMEIPRDRTVVFVVDDPGPQPESVVPLAAYVIRSVLPASRMDHAYVYVGEPSAFLERRPTLRGFPPAYDEVSRRFWTEVRPRLGDHVALVLGAFNPAYEKVAADRPAWVAAPGLAVLEGPRPAGALAAPSIPRAPRGLGGVAGMGAASFGLILLAGAGWAIALRPRGGGWVEALALAPASGLAAVLLWGVLVTAAVAGTGALPLPEGSLAAVPAVAAAAGLAAALTRWRRDRAAGAATPRQGPDLRRSPTPTTRPPR